MIDSSVIRVHQQWEGSPKKEGPDAEETGRSRGGLTIKIHALTDSEGRVAGLKLTPGQAHDLTATDELIEATRAMGWRAASRKQKRAMGWQAASRQENAGGALSRREA